MSETLYLLTVCLPLATVLLIFGMRYLSAFQQARVRLANDDAYRLVAERAVATQAETAAALAALNAALAEAGARLGAIETILKAVE
jgi:hypothetical protein